jgi:hypothetical protein
MKCGFSIRTRSKEAINELEDIHFTENEKARMNTSQVKAMIVIFFDVKGVIMIERVLEGQTVNQRYYLEVLTKLRERLRRKRPELWKKKSWILHQDNAQTYSFLAIKQFLANKCIPCRNPPLVTGFSRL